MVNVLLSCEYRSHDELCAITAQETEVGGWRTAAGDPPSVFETSSVISDIVCRGEAYGLITQLKDPVSNLPTSARTALMPAARLLYAWGFRMTEPELDQRELSDTLNKLLRETPSANYG